MSLNLVFLGLLFALVWMISRLLIRETEGGRSSNPSSGARLVSRIDGASHPLRAKTTLGRDPSSDVLLTDEFCSAQHAVIEWRGGRWMLTDLSSTNGTTVNEISVHETEVQKGDIIGLGRHDFTVEG